MKSLRETASLNAEKLISTNDLSLLANITTDAPILIVLAAGKGTRFGTEPKCIQPIKGIPLARHAIDAFQSISLAPAICIVGYRYQEVAGALGDDNIYVRTENPTGGTAHAAYEAFCVSQLLTIDPVVVITMGDRIVPAAVFQKLFSVHRGSAQENHENGEAALTLLTAEYAPPRNQGKGRILRNPNGHIAGIREQKDIEKEADPQIRHHQLELTEGNCPLYMTRARTLHRLLSRLTNDNAQAQFYITDMVAQLAAEGATIRSVTTTPADPEYPLLCADVTRAEDLPRLEQIHTAYGGT